MSNNVIIYTVAGCPKCHNAKKYLDEHHITYKEFDVKQNSAKAKEMIQKSGQRSVPVLDINGSIIVGLQPQEILAALE